MKSAIVLLSGGQDSATSLFWALNEFETVHALSFDYGQKHKKELEYAGKICEIVGVKQTVLPVAGLLHGSSLVDHTKDVSAPHHIDNTLPSSFTPGRNVLFLTLAASLAYENNIQDIVTGVCQTDYSGYFDCRRVFIDSMEVSLSLATGKDFRIHTPLMYLTKAETWKLVADLGRTEKIEGLIPVDGSDTGFRNSVVEVIRTLTLTDYNGDDTLNDWGRGKEDNPASILRAKGYREAVAKGWV